MTNIYIRQIIYNRTNVWVMQQLLPITPADVHTSTHMHMHTHIFKVYIQQFKKGCPQKIRNPNNKIQNTTSKYIIVDFRLALNGSIGAVFE